MKNKNEKETLLTTRRKLREQVDILIVSSEDYLTQITKCIRELKIICRKEVERWTSEDIVDIAGNFNALKDILVFGDIEDEIPVLLEKLENPEGKCENCGNTPDLVECDDCQELFCLDCLEGGYCQDCQPDTIECGHCQKKVLAEESDSGYCLDCFNDCQECNGCGEIQPPDYQWENCWKCDEEICGDCVINHNLDGEETKLCRDCSSNL